MLRLDSRREWQTREPCQLTNASIGLDRVRTALRDTERGEFAEAARSLLAELGYRSDRTLSDQTGGVNHFIDTYPAQKAGTRSENMFRDEDPAVRILFQVTDAEIHLPLSESEQQGLFESPGVDTGQARSFLFVTVELRTDTYARHTYAQITREINKRFSMPTVVLFRTARALLTLAFVHRRAHKRDARRDVLGSVSLIREINPTDPHRAHLDILEELSLLKRLEWMDSHGKSRNFDGLLDAWLDALDTEELNKRFYSELFGWFTLAVNEARFPTTEVRTLDPEEHVIRLITRLLFVWFIKEKGLVADDLFIKERVAPLLMSYDQEAGDSYYRAVLQNLFFATLNTEISRRRFSEVNPTTHRSFSLYRYLDEMRDPESLIRLFNKTPFINGGLFDCLDSEESATRGGYRIDCFSDNLDHRGRLSIPDRLFFGPTGLIDMFNRYRFTVEENTPTEQEVALDPELLGKVFENLLAAYNPETRETARKQTGSYYTPRQVVDYMVDEALVASLARSTPPHDGDTEFWTERLHYLLDHADAFDDAEQLFTPDERDSIIRRIAEIKIIDPAVGSGAFPMAILHKLTLALRRLDRDNQRWESLQKEIATERARSAFDTKDQNERDAELKEISDTFEKYRRSDFGRKLYLIQNSIFGVDIQPIACQIAKLRFFISLAIEQEPDPDAHNFGIKPLPNLETRFVAADTLLGLRSQQRLNSGRSRRLEQELHTNRQRHFHATTRQQKLALSDKSKELRDELAAELQLIGMPAGDAARIANWDPYDQNAHSDWFDTAYMFGITDGFDVVIGNPPYIQLQRDRGKLGRRYKGAGYATFTSRGDIYQLFYEKGCQLLRLSEGLLTYITSNSWLKAEYGKPLRNYLSTSHTPLLLLETGKDVFDAVVDTSILLLRHGGGTVNQFRAVGVDRHAFKEFPPDKSVWGHVHPDGTKPWSILSATEWRVMQKVLSRGIPLKTWSVVVNYGVKTGYNAAFIIDDTTRAELIAEDPSSANIIKPILRGRDIRRYQAQWAGSWLIVAKFGSYKTLPREYPAVYKYLQHHEVKLRARGQCRYSRSGQNRLNEDYRGQHHWLELDNNPKDNYLSNFAKDKLFWIELVENGRFAYDNSGMYGEATTFILTGQDIKYLCSVLNARLISWFLRQVAPTSGMGVPRWKKIYIEEIPIPKLSPTDQRPFVRLVDSILVEKNSDPSADTSEQEAEIDRLVYELYGLTAEEIAAVAD